MTPQERVINRAKGEVGYLEKASNAQLDDKTANAGKNNWTKYARDLDGMGNIYNGKKNGYDWCDVFVDWCFITEFGEETGMALLCQAYQGLGAGCKYSMNYYANKGQLFHSPKPGDQIFFGDSASIWHTGLVSAVDGTFVYTIEGNTASASGVIPNGGMVAEKRYYKTSSYIAGYGRPDWNLVKEDEEMSYETWKEYMEQYRKELQEKPGSGWSEAARKWATENGVFIGGNEDEGMMWQDFVTREQLAQIEQRLHG